MTTARKKQTPKLGPATIAARALGTLALVIGFVVFVSRAPFLAGADGSGTDPERPPLGVQVPAELLAESGTMKEALVPTVGPAASGLAFEPSFGLFNGNFAATSNQPGFHTGEHTVSGDCLGAGQRYFESECPGCGLLGGDVTGDTGTLMWQQTIDGKSVVRAVSRHCISMGPDGLPVVGSLTFGDGPAHLGHGAAVPDTTLVPLLVGATRVATISLGDWSATYDDVARPGTALPDMAAALGKRGWREVSDHPEVRREKAFQGHRVFTNDTNAVCMISLTGQGDSYQLLTIINSRA
jgi:hypothetical protein